MIQSASHPSATSSRDPILAELFDEITKRLQAGEPVNIESYITRHPDRAAELRGVLPAIEMLVELGRSSASRPGPIPTPTRSASEGDPLDSADHTATDLGRLGDFRIIREIGRGGMGVVYEAEQISMRRRVALKVLPFAAVMDAKQIQRFKNEALAAGQLQHTNIVPVYSVGCERGVHFYAMQFIDGQTLAEVIRELRVEGRELRARDESQNDSAPSASDGPSDDAAASTVQQFNRSTVQRSAAVAALSTERSTRPKEYFRTVARMGIQAAEALEHAHEIGVIHRDIKPSNLLLDVRGNLWITDFGLARFGTDGNLTMTGDLLGTLRYMSPEQALAKRVLVDHRTDIYSLGVTLYELITLEPAFTGQDRQELLKQIAFDEPRPPRRLNRDIPVELETIVLAAISKSPESRFSTAQALADDLRRFLENKPIVAKPPSMLERLAKWSERHRPLVRLSYAFVCVAAVFFAVSTWMIARERDVARMQRTRANLRAQLARKAADEMYTQVAEQWLANQPQLEEVQRQFLIKARDAYEELSRDAEQVGEFLYETGQAYERVGKIDVRLGAYDDASTAYQRAIETFQKIAATEPSNPAVQLSLGEAIADSAAVPYAVGRFAEAEQIFRDAAAMLDRLAKAFPNSPEHCHALARVLVNLAAVNLEMHHQGGGPLVGADSPLVDAAVNSVMQHPAETERAAQRAAEILESLPVDYPTSIGHLDLLAQAYNELAMGVQALGRHQEAEECFSKAIASLQRLPDQDHRSQKYHIRLGQTFQNLGVLFQQTNRLEQAQDAYRKAVAMYDQLVADFPMIVEFRRHRGHLYLNLQLLSLSHGRFEEAADFCRQALERNPDDVTSIERLIWILAFSPTPSLHDYPEAVRLATKLNSLRNQEPSTWLLLGRVKYRTGDWVGSLAALEQADQSGGDPNPAATWLYTAMAHWQMKHQVNARQWYDRAAQWMETNKIDNHGPPDDDLSELRSEAAELLGKKE